MWESLRTGPLDGPFALVTGSETASLEPPLYRQPTAVYDGGVMWMSLVDGDGPGHACGRTAARTRALFRSTTAADVVAAGGVAAVVSQSDFARQQPPPPAQLDVLDIATGARLYGLALRGAPQAAVAPDGTVLVLQGDALAWASPAAPALHPIARSVDVLGGLGNGTAVFAVRVAGGFDVIRAADLATGAIRDLSPKLTRIDRVRPDVAWDGTHLAYDDGSCVLAGDLPAATPATMPAAPGCPRPPLTTEVKRLQRRHAVRIRARCPGGSADRCTGTARITARIGGRTRVLAAQRLDLAGGGATAADADRQAQPAAARARRRRRPPRAAGVPHDRRPGRRRATSWSYSGLDRPIGSLRSTRRRLGDASVPSRSRPRRARAARRPRDAGASPTATVTAARAFDLEAHRGGRGLRPENTLASFGKALQLGVTTLELDTAITKDGQVLVTHEPRILALQCQDTGANHFVGQLVKDLTLAQAKTLDCGTRHPTAPGDEFVGTQESVPGTRMPTLDEVFDLAERYGARDIQFNIETKIDPTAPNDTVDALTFTRKVLDVIRAHHAVDRSLLQSFDWRTLVIARQLEPRLRRVALGDATTIFPGSPWTAGIRIPADALQGSLARIVANKLRAQVVSLDFTILTDRLIRKSHEHGLGVIPWTVNAPADMASLIDRGVDGIITDYPDRLRDVMAAKRLRLPQAFASPFDVEGHRGGRRYRPENTLASFRFGLSLPVTRSSSTPA